ncbi:MFS transporter [Streptomyces sp. NPDC056975]|uniref:MFS transporter n=1 Tax=Streptomyces sp. NPDC056975 TaxID=3345985 RepID=UPI00363AB2FD
MSSGDGGPAMPSHARITMALGVGQLIEWFDWTLYASFAVFFAGSFFPAGHGGETALLSAFAVYAVGFLFRPLGGVVLGHLADRFGRGIVFNLTVLLMAGGSLAIAVIPTFGQIGIAAPVLLILARAVQGLSAGGEMPSSTALATEAAPAGRRAFHSSALFVGSGIGVLLASLLGWLLTSTLTDAQISGFGWRVAFGFGAVLGLVGLALRRSLLLPEQAMAQQLAPGPAGSDGHALRRPGGFVGTVRTHGRSVLRVAGFAIAATVGFYTLTVYMSTHLQVQVGMHPATAFKVNCIMLLVYSVMLPLSGLAADRWGRRPVMGWSALAMAVVLVPCVALMSREVAVTLPLLLVCFALLGVFHGPFPALMSEQFPAEKRGLGVGTSYSLVAALFGGTATYLATWLRSLGHPLWFFGYVAATFALAAVTMYVIPETASVPSDLESPADGSDLTAASPALPNPPRHR